MSVFYAYSNNRDETRDTYNKICEKIEMKMESRIHS